MLLLTNLLYIFFLFLFKIVKLINNVEVVEPLFFQVSKQYTFIYIFNIRFFYLNIRPENNFFDLFRGSEDGFAVGSP